MDKPATPSGFNYVSSLTITHNLGYVPLVRAFYDPDSIGTIYPVNGQSGTQTAGPTSLPFWFYIDDITSTQVIFKCEGFSLLSGTFPIYYRIYLDFEQ
jgi:hypothetical protein